MFQARESLKNRWGLAVGGNVVYLILVVLIQMVPKIGWIASLILGGPLLLGWSVFFLSFSRKQDAQIAQIFEGFNRFVNGLAAYLLMSLFILLWTLLFIIPGIVAYLSYSQAFFILAENPQLEGREALRRSKTLMKGNRLKLFFLFWRFFGWFLLGVASLGIGFLWIMPYLGTTLARFYDDLQQNAGPVPMEGPILQPIHP
jgi:uncharacterized membrane protein